MKLLTKTSIYYLLLSIVLFAFTGIIFYLNLRNHFEEDITENLYIEKSCVEKFVIDSLRFPLNELKVGITLQIKNDSGPFQDLISDTLINAPWEEELQLFRQLVFSVDLNNNWYKVVLSSPLYESDDLIEKISWSMLVVSVVLLWLLYILNKWISKKAMKPFYRTLEQLEKFKSNESSDLCFEYTNIQEFETLNQKLLALTKKVRNDFKTLKEFTENASHEIQTPLAIISAKLELLMQQDGISVENAILIQQSYEAVHRLSKLNQSLLLLAKIENNQFADENDVNINEVVSSKLNELLELLELKKIEVTTNLAVVVMVKMNQTLAEILISNLLGNAIKHNLEGGRIDIASEIDGITISNTGSSIEVDPQIYFRRFQTDNSKQSSVGLGLSIVQQICELYQYNIGYTIQDNIHRLTVHF